MRIRNLINQLIYGLKSEFAISKLEGYDIFFFKTYFELIKNVAI